MKFNPLVAFGVVAALGLGLMVFLSGQSHEATGEAFMQALAKKDVKKLTELSYLEKPVRPLQEQWDECVNKRAKTYNFVWVWEGSYADTKDLAIMRIHLIEFKGAELDESETFEIPIIRVGGRWKVDLASLSRKFFPALPR